MNKSILIWNITQDVIIKTTEKGTKIAITSIATNEFYKDQSWEKKQVTDFHNIVAFWKLADLLENYVKKGQKIYIEWKSKTRSWDKDDWSKWYKTEVHVEKIEFLWGAKKDWSEIEKISKDNVNDGSFNDEISIEDIPF